MTFSLLRDLRPAILICALFFSAPLQAGDESIPFDSDAWQITAGSVVTHLDRQCLMGNAHLTDAEFTNGVIEVDLAVTGRRSYPGINFRTQGPGEHEHVYIRPHRAGLYPDAVQYTPVHHGISGWQLYNGEGFTAVTPELPTDRWVPLRLEVKGTQARLFIDNADQPALIVDDLKRGSTGGSIGLSAPADGSAWFSNFRFQSTDELDFAPPPPPLPPPLGMFSEWELSRVFDISQIDLEKSPAAQGLEDMGWETINADPTGLVNIARHRARSGAPADCVYARTTIHSNPEQVRSLRFGYSDAVCVFLNGQLLYLGNSAYRQRDPSFLGIVGLNDSVYLPLKEGENELLLAVIESFGGWGFICQDGDFVLQDKRLSKAWELRKGLRYPESVVYDPNRDVLYASNFNLRGTGFISKVTLDGRIEELEWIAGLSRPTGLCIHDDRLYAVERTGLVEIDPETGQVAARHPILSPGFINDVAFDDSGAAYITDSARSVIHRLHDGESEVWLEGEETIADPNGICIVGDELVFGNSGDGSLKAVNLRDKSVRTVVTLGPGAIMDGVRPDGRGGLMISDFNGRVFQVSPAGAGTELLNTTVRNEYAADIEYIPGRDLLIIPTLYDNRIIAYRLTP